VDWIVVAEKANSGAKTQQKRRANKFMANFYSKISKVSKLYENEKQNRGLPPPFSEFSPSSRSWLFLLWGHNLGLPMYHAMPIIVDLLKRYNK